MRALLEGVDDRVLSRRQGPANLRVEFRGRLRIDRRNRGGSAVTAVPFRL